MSITLSCNVFPDNQQSRPTTEEMAEHDAYLATLPPAPHPAPASIAELLARLDPSPPAPEDGVDPITAWLCELVTRPVDAVTRVAVAALDPATLTGKAARDYLVLTDKVLAADSAVQHGAVLAAADTARTEVETILTENSTAAAGTKWSGPDTERIVREDLERTLGCTRNDAAARLQQAEDLRERVPATGRQLAAGMVSARKASQLVHLLESTTPDVAAQIDTELAEHLHAARPSSLRRRIARRLLALDTDHADRQDREVVRGRTVRTWSNPDGSATLSLTGPPEAIQHAWHATTGTALAQLREARDAGVRPAADIPAHGGTHSVVEPVETTTPAGDFDELNHRQGDDSSVVEPVETTSRPGDFDELNHRGANNAPLSERDGSGRMDRARFDAAIDLLCSAYDAPWFPASQGKRRTLVQLVTTVATLTGIDDNLAELVGHGSVTAETAPLGPRWRASASQ